MELPVILLVDPDSDAAQSVVSILSAQGWWVSVVPDRGAALRAAAAHAPDLVLVHQRAMVEGGVLESFGSAAGGIAVVVLDPDSRLTEVSGVDFTLQGEISDRELTAVARRLMRAPRSRADEEAAEAKEEKLTSQDIFGDMLDSAAPVGTRGLVKLAGVRTPLDGRAVGVTARVHFTGASGLRDRASEPPPRPAEAAAAGVSGAAVETIEELGMPDRIPMEPSGPEPISEVIPEAAASEPLAEPAAAGGAEPVPERPPTELVERSVELPAAGSAYPFEAAFEATPQRVEAPTGEEPEEAAESSVADPVPFEEIAAAADEAADRPGSGSLDVQDLLATPDPVEVADRSAEPIARETPLVDEAMAASLWEDVQRWSSESSLEEDPHGAPAEATVEDAVDDTLEVAAGAAVEDVLEDAVEPESEPAVEAEPEPEAETADEGAAVEESLYDELSDLQGSDPVPVEPDGIAAESAVEESSTDFGFLAPPPAATERTQGAAVEDSEASMAAVDRLFGFEGSSFEPSPTNDVESSSVALPEGPVRYGEDPWAEESSPSPAPERFDRELATADDVAGLVSDGDGDRVSERRVVSEADVVDFDSVETGRDVGSDEAANEPALASSEEARGDLHPEAAASPFAELASLFDGDDSTATELDARDRAEPDVEAESIAEGRTALPSIGWVPYREGDDLMEEPPAPVEVDEMEPIAGAAAESERVALDPTVPTTSPRERGAGTAWGDEALAAASTGRSWLWIAAALLLVIAAGWFLLRPKTGEVAAARPAPEDADAAGAAGGAEPGAVGVERVESEPSAEHRVRAPDTDREDLEREIDAVLDQREAEIRQRFEIERARLEEELAAMRERREQEISASDVAGDS